MLFVAADNHFQTFMTAIIGRIFVGIPSHAHVNSGTSMGSLRVDRVIEPQIAQTLQAHAAMRPSRHRWARVGDMYLLYHAIRFLTNPWAVRASHGCTPSVPPHAMPDALATGIRALCPLSFLDQGRTPLNRQHVVLQRHDPDANALRQLAEQRPISAERDDGVTLQQLRRGAVG